MSRARGPVVSEVVIPGVEGNLSGVLLEPRTGGSGPGPAVIVLPEIDGFCEGTVVSAQRLADAGYVTLALDLYAPYGSTPVLRGSEDTMAWLARLNDRRQLSDLALALTWLKGRPDVDADRVAVLGFSVGGRYAMMVTTEPHGIRAVAALYSRPWPGGAIADVALAPGQHVARFGVPVCAVFGDDDDMIPAEMVEQFRALLDEHRTVGHELHVVAGRHFFANVSRPRRYRADSTDQAWAIVLAFLATHLQPRSIG